MYRSSSYMSLVCIWCFVPSQCAFDVPRQGVKRDSAESLLPREGERLTLPKPSIGGLRCMFYKSYPIYIYFEEGIYLLSDCVNLESIGTLSMSQYLVRAIHCSLFGAAVPPGGVGNFSSETSIWWVQGILLI